MTESNPAAVAAELRETAADLDRLGDNAYNAGEPGDTAVLLDAAAVVRKARRLLAALPVPVAPDRGEEAISAVLWRRVQDATHGACCDGNGTCGTTVCVRDETRVLALIEAAELADAQLGDDR